MKLLKIPEIHSFSFFQLQIRRILRSRVFCKIWGTENGRNPRYAIRLVLGQIIYILSNFYSEIHFLVFWLIIIEIWILKYKRFLFITSFQINGALIKIMFFSQIRQSAFQSKKFDASHNYTFKNNWPLNKIKYNIEVCLVPTQSGVRVVGF